MRVYQVPNMGCGGCAKAITRAVSALDPQATVDPDLEARTVAVETGASEADLLAALARAGYRATPVAPAPADAAASR